MQVYKVTAASTRYERLNYLTFAAMTMLGGCFIGFLVGLGLP